MIMQETIPALSKSAQRAITLINDPETTLYDLRQLVESEPAYTGVVLRVANSPIFRGAREITSVSQAIVRLGSVMIGNLILSLVMRNHADDSDTTRAAWRASIATGAWSLSICRHTEGLSNMADTGFTAGILSGIGEIAHAACPQAYQKYDPEQTAFILLQQWNLPEVLLTSIRIGRHLQAFAQRAQPVPQIPQNVHEAVALGAALAGRHPVPDSLQPHIHVWQAHVEEVEALIRAFAE